MDKGDGGDGSGNKIISSGASTYNSENSNNVVDDDELLNKMKKN